MADNNGERLTARTRLALLIADGGAMFIAFALLVSLSLMAKPRIVEDVKTAVYHGPFAWLGRLMGFTHLSQTSRAEWYIGLMIVLAVAWIAAIWLVRRQRGRRFTLVLTGGFLLFSLLFIFIPSFMSTDVFSYAFIGRVMSVYHKNPYLLLPVGRKQDLFYTLVGWKSNASVYGPLFNWVAALVTRISGESVSSTVLGFKLVSLAFFGGTLPFVYSLAKRVSPGRENFALAMTAWSPLLILHMVGAGHNDSMMIFFIVLGFFLYRKDHPVWGMVAMSLAVTVKISAVLVLAPYVVFFLKDRRGSIWPRLGETVAAGVLLPAALYIPFWSGPRIFNTTLVMQKDWSSTSLPTFLQNVTRDFLNGMGVSYARSVNFSASLVKNGLLLLLIVVAIAVLWKVRSYRSMVMAAAILGLLWFLTTPWMLPWYLALPLVLTAITGWNVTTAATMASSVVFMFFRIPRLMVKKAATAGTTAVKTVVTKPVVPTRPMMYLGVSFLVILLAWLVWAEQIPWVRRALARALSRSDATD